MIVELKEPLFRQLGAIADQKGIPAFVVGGFVRDLFLERPSKDVDIVVVGDGIEMAKAFADTLKGKKEVAYFKNFGTAMVRSGSWEVEFVGARKESYNFDSRKPQVKPGSLTDDQNRRDFTINALAISLAATNFGELMDPFNGMADLEQGIIRTPLDPDITFSDDPLRMMRAIRFATQLNFTIHPETLEAITRNKDRIGIISAERISEELNKIILAPVPSKGLRLLFDTGLLHLIFPELAAMHGVEVVNGKSHKDNFYHTLQVLDNICTETDDLWLRWSALLHDIAKPLTKKFENGGWTFHGHEDKGSRMVSRIFRRMKLPLNEKMKFVEKLVYLHHRPKALAEEGVTDSAIRRLIVEAGDELEALFTLCRADMTSRNQQKLDRYRQNLKQVELMTSDVAERDRLRNWQPPITGEDIMQTFGIGPSREVGLIKQEIRESILEGRIKNEYEDARSLMLELGRNMGLKPQA